MSDYQELLEATISHLQELKRRGERFVVVSPETMSALNGKMNAARPAPVPGGARPTAAALNRPTTYPATTAISATAKAVVPTVPAPASSPLTKTPVPVLVPSSVPPPPIITARGNESSPKAKAMTELRDRALVCVKCPHLAASRKSVVFGVGNIDSELMFVGEAPGADEDAEGEPFVGKAGELLTKMIKAMGLSRESVYIANILKCRPDTPGQSYGNRPPTPEEIKNCLPYLNAQIELIKPKAIVALGATAHDGLFGKIAGMGITRVRGSFKEYRGIPVMPTYHPSYLLRPNVNNIKREAWEDMLKVMQHLSMAISEKQQGYFLQK
jgi:DNA polymerase